MAFPLARRIGDGDIPGTLSTILRSSWSLAAGILIPLPMSIQFPRHTMDEFSSSVSAAGCAIKKPPILTVLAAYLVVRTRMGTRREIADRVVGNLSVSLVKYVADALLLTSSSAGPCSPVLPDSRTEMCR